MTDGDAREALILADGSGYDRAMSCLADVVAEARACRWCEAHLPHGPRPVVRATVTARLLIVGQAPGRRVHLSGIPWDDPSGDRLREWLGVDRTTFYDETRIAIVPMGLCYPGTVGGADLPPRPECAPLWHPRLLPLLRQVELTLLVGGYAQAFHLANARGRTMTATVRAFGSFLPAVLPLPHPSWRNSGWIVRNPWFAHELLPVLRARVGALLAGLANAPAP